MVYLQINTVKYNVDWEIMITYEKLWIVWSQFFHQFANIHLYLVNNKKLLVYGYSDKTFLINGKYVFSRSQIFGKLKLTFVLQIGRWNKINRIYLVSTDKLYRFRTTTPRSLTVLTTGSSTPSAAPSCKSSSIKGNILQQNDLAFF